MDRLEAMSTLLAAVEVGSLSAASRKLRVPLSTVSRKVSELEALPLLKPVPTRTCYPTAPSARTCEEALDYVCLLGGLRG
jgi:DNA-binding transcriptional LysR family regulator